MIVQYEVTTLVRQVFLGPTIRDALQIACGDLSNPLVVCRRFDLLRLAKGAIRPIKIFGSKCAPGRIRTADHLVRRENWPFLYALKSITCGACQP